MPSEDSEYDKVRKQRELDEGITSLTDMYPRIWRSLYLKLVDEGFTEAQAFSLTKVYILSQCPNGVHIHKD